MIKLIDCFICSQWAGQLLYITSLYAYVKVLVISGLRCSPPLLRVALGAAIRSFIQTRINVQSKNIKVAETDYIGNNKKKRGPAIMNK